MDSLGNQHPVEWVAQRTRQCAGKLAMDKRDRQWNETLTVEQGREIRRDRRYTWQLADAELRRDFPGGRCAVEDCIALVGNGRVRG